MEKENFFIIVLYNCRLNDSQSFNSILRSLKHENQNAYFYIYDNSPKSQLININSQFCAGFNYIHNPDNPGLSVAYNAGAAHAQTLGFKWITLMDQDTEFSIDFLQKLNSAIVDQQSIILFAPILKLKSGCSFSPARYKCKRGFSVNLQYGLHSLMKYSPVNSGLTINLSAFYAAGGYNDEVRLDFADFQFIERLRKIHKEFYLINSAATQDFSNENKDINQNISRFEIFLDCAKKCNRESFIDDFLYLYSVSRHVLALMLKFRNPIFAKLFYFNYLRTKG